MCEFLKQCLADTLYNLVDASNLSIYEIQDLLRECRINNKLVVFVSKTLKSTPFFNSLRKFKLDSQNSNYYASHSRNYAVWVREDEIDKQKFLSFLKESDSNDKTDMLSSMVNQEGERII